MRFASSLFVILLVTSFIACTNPVDESISLYEDFRRSWRNSNNYQFLDYYYPETTDESDIENIKAERDHLVEQVGYLNKFVTIEIDHARELDKWVFEGQVFYEGTIEINSTVRYEDDLTFQEIAYVVVDENHKRWIAHSQIRKENK